jgi:hypothetical protein
MFSLLLHSLWYHKHLRFIFYGQKACCDGGQHDSLNTYYTTEINMENVTCLVLSTIKVSEIYRADNKQRNWPLVAGITVETCQLSKHFFSNESWYNL